MRVAGMGTSDCATAHQASGRPFPRKATVVGMWSGQLILGAVPLEGPTLSTVFYTPSVVNTPGSIPAQSAARSGEPAKR